MLDFEAMFDGFEVGNGVKHLVVGHTESLTGKPGSVDVADVVSADEACGEWRILEIVGRVAEDGCDIRHGTGGDIREVVVEDSDSVGRERVDELELGFLHVLDGLERLQMLLADGSEDADGGVDEVANLGDIARLFGSHLNDENFGIRLKVLADGSDDAEGGVEAARSHNDAETLGKNTIKIMLGAGLAIRAGDADNYKARHCREDAASIANVPGIDEALDGHQKDESQRDPKGRKRGESHRKDCGGNEMPRSEVKSGGEEKKTDEEDTNSAGSEYKRLFVFSQELANATVKRQNAYCTDEVGSPTSAERKNSVKWRNGENQQIDQAVGIVSVAKEPTPITREAIGVLLQHLQLIAEADGGVKGDENQRDDIDDGDCHELRKLSIIALNC